MPLYVTKMRGLDLTIFNFDHDLSWACLLLSPQGHVLARYGTRTADSYQGELSLKGLRYTLEQALLRFRREKLPARNQDPQRPEDFAGARRFAPRSCIHCHNVHEFQREQKQQAGTWRKDDVWIYPEPGNVGLTLDLDQGDRVIGVAPKSAGAEAGLKPGDVLERVGEHPVASLADMRHALHHAPAEGSLPIVWNRAGAVHKAALKLQAGWRVYDVSWRWSNKTLGPAPAVHGDDLSVDEKRKLGLQPAQLAFRQGPFRTRIAEQAGIEINDVIIGVDGKQLSNMKFRQFEIYIRLNYRAGDTVHYDLLRQGKRLQIKLRLPSS